ncbi:MAG: hypothetical protein DHS20C19_13050 [Acidimicrobiales bacterium]|nr:MAG: hypothetical protein DHS20C19_13050 [Acidimicrobiales bacterium]
MLLADIGDTGYNIILLLHILAMFVAFSPAFVHPFIENDTQGMGDARQRIFTGIASRGMKIYGSALIVGGLLGFGVAGMSKAPGTDELVYSVSDSWVWPAVVLWLAMNGVLHGMILKGEKGLAAGDDSAAKTVALGGQLITVMFLVTMYLMVFKPGA